MLLINYIFAISTALAYTDYFPDTDAVFDMFGTGYKVKEDYNPNSSEALKSDEIQVVSFAVHGGKIEFETEKFSKDLFIKVKDTRKRSEFYNFISDISTKESGDYYNGRCIPTHCCNKIKKKVKINGNYVVVDEDNGNHNEDTCKSFKIEEDLRKELNKKLKLNKGVCKFKEVCYLNAAHVTSEVFRTKKLEELLPNRYPVSFHGFQDKKDLPVDIVLGGLSKQKYELAKLYHKATKGKIRVAICRSGDNCRVYNPKKEKFEDGALVNASGLSGSAENNFVNLGLHKCGLQLELSTTFRNSSFTSTAHWESLVQSILNTLPKKRNGESQREEEKRICDDKELYRKNSNDAKD